MGLYQLGNGMVEALSIPQIIDSACGPADPRTLMSVGTLVKAFILNIFDQRTPVYLIGESFKDVDCEVLFGPNINWYDFTEDRLGSALDALSEIDQRSSLCMAKEKGTASHSTLTGMIVYGSSLSSPSGSEESGGSYSWSMRWAT